MAKIILTGDRRQEDCMWDICRISAKKSGITEFGRV